MKPIMIKQPLEQKYFHSYGQDSPWFAAVSNGILLGSKCTHCNFVTANPKLTYQECYSTDSTVWTKLPSESKIHAFTVCHLGAEAFLDQTPFISSLMEFKGVDTIFLTRVIVSTTQKHHSTG